jgi:dipeptidyl aminopeptidase/acylaminoacyl peptidase
MGIQGVSFGGFEVNYIVTRTNLFAAACSASGISDLASVTYALRSDVGESAEYVSEQTQMRMRGPVWKYPEDYMRNSPLYHADEVTTPLLIMANDGDGKVPWTQGVEWFLALRRLQRPVWMLQYNGDKHTLVNTLNQEDYTERMMQFFDHYLKGGPLPVWMLQER